MKSSSLEIKNAIVKSQSGGYLDYIQHFELVLSTTKKGLLHCLLLQSGGSGLYRTMLYQLLLGEIRPDAGAMTLNNTLINDYTGEKRARLGIRGYYYTPGEQAQSYISNNFSIEASLLLVMGYNPRSKDGIKKLESYLEQLGLSKEYYEEMRESPSNKKTPYVRNTRFLNTLVCGIGLMRSPEQEHKWLQKIKSYIKRYHKYLPYSLNKKTYSYDHKTKLLVAGQPSTFGFEPMDDYRKAVKFLLDQGVNILHADTALAPTADYVHYYPDHVHGRYIDSLSLQQHYTTRQGVTDLLQGGVKECSQEKSIKQIKNTKLENAKNTDNLQEYLEGFGGRSSNFYGGNNTYLAKKYFSDAKKLAFYQKYYDMESTQYAKLGTIDNLVFDKRSLAAIVENAAFLLNKRQQHTTENDYNHYIHPLSLGIVQGTIDYTNLCFSDTPQQGQFVTELFIGPQGIMPLIQGILEYHYIHCRRFAVKNDHVYFSDSTDIGTERERSYLRREIKYFSILQLREQLRDCLFDSLHLRELFANEYAKQATTITHTGQQSQQTLATYKQKVINDLSQGKIPGSEFYKYASVVDAYTAMRATPGYQQFMVKPEYKLVSQALQDSFSPFSHFSHAKKELLVEIGHGDGALLKKLINDNETIATVPKALFDESIMMGMALDNNNSDDTTHNQGTKNYTRYHQNYFDTPHIHQQKNKVLLICGLLHNLTLEDHSLQNFLANLYQTMHTGDELIFSLPGEQPREMVQQIYKSSAVIEAFSQEVVVGKPPYGEVMQREMTFDPQTKTYQAKLHILKSFTYRLGHKETIDVPVTTLYGIPSRRQNADFYKKYLCQAGFAENKLVIYEDKKTQYLVIRCCK